MRLDRGDAKVANASSVAFVYSADLCWDEATHRAVVRRLASELCQAAARGRGSTPKQAMTLPAAAGGWQGHGHGAVVMSNRAPWLEWEAAGFAEKEDDWFFFAWDDEEDDE